MRALKIGWVALSALLVPVWAGFAVSVAQDAKGERPQVQGAAQGGGNALPAWIVTCSNANPSAVFACAMQQSLQMQDTGQRIASVTIRKDGEQAIAIIQLPHGVSLSAGVDVSVDDGPVAKLPIESADQNGSYARLLMDDATSKAMRAGTILRIVATSMTGEQLKLEMSLSGFSKSQDILLTHG